MHHFMRALCSLSVLTVLNACAATIPRYSETPVRCIERHALRVKYAGTTTLAFSDGQNQVLLDGFFSRPPLLQWLTGPLVSNPQRIQQALQQLQLSDLDVIAVFHSHFDHVMDSAAVAKITGAKILGSASTARVARGAGVPESQIIVAEAGKSYRFGRFEILMLPGQHMSLGPVASALGLDGDIEMPFSQPAHLLDYQEGGTYSIVIQHPEGNSLLQGTRLTPAVQQAQLVIDTVFLTTPGFHNLSMEQKSVFTQFLQKTKVRRVVAVHWDDFSRPLDLPLQSFPQILDDFQGDARALQAMLVSAEIPLHFWPAWHTDCFDK